MCADVWAIIISTLGRQDVLGRILLVIFQDTPERHLRDSDSELCLKLIFVIIVIFHVGQQEVFAQSICRDEVFIFVQKQIFKRSAVFPTN